MEHDDGTGEISAGDGLRAVLKSARSGAAYTFYRGEHANFLPVKAEMRQPGALSGHVLAGWMPDTPFIDRDTTIVAFGSCFAGHISRYLNNLGFDVATRQDTKAYVSVMGDGMVNVFAICQQFEWAWENKVPAVELWHGFKAEEFGYDEAVRLKTRELFDSADVFVITLGLSEIWYDEPTGEVFWRAVPFDKFNPERHKFRVASVIETYENLERIHQLIRRHRPDAAIIFTVSPIPLSATFRPVSCLTASSASKAILRAAVDELCRRKQPEDRRLFYYPAYEIVTQCFQNPFAVDFRHPQFHVLDLVMKAFERYFCTTGLTDEMLAQAYDTAVKLDLGLSGDQAAALQEQILSAAVQWLKDNPSGLLNLEQDEARRLAAEREERQAQRSLRQAEQLRAKEGQREERRAALEQRRSTRQGGAGTPDLNPS